MLRRCPVPAPPEDRNPGVSVRAPLRAPHQHKVEPGGEAGRDDDVRHDEAEHVGEAATHGVVDAAHSGVQSVWE